MSPLKVYESSEGKINSQDDKEYPEAVYKIVEIINREDKEKKLKAQKEADNYIRAAKRRNMYKSVKKKNYRRTYKNV